MTPEEKAMIALKIIKKCNPLRNDFDTYLYDVACWGLGIFKDEPKPKDYGVRETK